MRVDKNAEFTYYSGHNSPEVAEAAARRGDIGLVITPSTAYLMNRLESYEKAIVDNGAFQQRGFEPKRFLRLLDRIAARPAVRAKIQFVVAPDVVAKARETLRLFRVWAPQIRARGFRVALAGQDGIERLQEEIPWHDVDAFFVGGTTEWKLGAGESREWDELLRRAQEHGPIHVGRVNSCTRMDFASWMGASSADGTYTRFCPRENVRHLECFLDNVNTVTFGAPAQPWQSLLDFGT
jgi:hypothetical protein